MARIALMGAKKIISNAEFRMTKFQIDWEEKKEKRKRSQNTFQTPPRICCPLKVDRCAIRGAIFFFQAEDGIRDHCVTGVQTCALPISTMAGGMLPGRSGRSLG